jgi:hypothetical protein
MADETTPDTTTNAALAPAPPAAKTPVRIGVSPTSLDEGWRLATMMAKSELVPKAFRNHPEDVLVAIQLGTEIGLAPMQALQSIAVINGRPSIWGDGFLALIMASPLYRDHDEYYEVDGQRVDGLNADALKQDTTTAVCTFYRRGKAEPVTRRFTVAQAKKAQLLGKDGPWQTYPDRMLLMRARSWAGRDCFPDLLRGIRTAEEALDESTATTRVRQVTRISETAGSRASAPEAEAEHVDETTGEVLPLTDDPSMSPERVEQRRRRGVPDPPAPITAADIPFGGR